MSDPDSFFNIMDEVMNRLAERLLEGGLGEPYPSGEESSNALDELIVGDSEVTYLMDARGQSKEDLLVSVLEDEVEVKGPDFIVRKKLPVKVQPDTAVSTFRNGILSVRVKKK